MGRRMIGFVVLCLFLLPCCTGAGRINANLTGTAQYTQTSLPPTSPPVPTPTLVPTPAVIKPVTPWWNDTVFYEIKVRSFYDSNGDGIGDINGVTAMLDYLNDGNPNTNTDLGITGIWLMPFYPSPSTHGFNITGFYAVNPQLGTMEDFKRLLDACHSRGIRVIIDLVLHNTSIEHPWFVQSRDPESPYRTWYLWSDTNPGFKGPGGQQVWFHAPTGWYLAYFWEGSPDLNVANPDVTAELYNVTRFWLMDIGVDGFRLDAIGKLIPEGTVLIETSATHNWFKKYYTFYKSVKQNAMTIGEVWTPDVIAAPYVTDHETDLTFEFDLSTAIRNSLINGTITEVLDTLQNGTSLFPAGQYGIFLTNHDMRRVMRQFDGDLSKAKAAAALYLTLPGVPFIYYGEEIGMTGEFNQVNPMQWSAGDYAGFSTFDQAKQIDAELHVDSNYTSSNVATESNQKDSLLNHYRWLISLRNTHPALRSTSMVILPTENPALFASLRYTEDEMILVLVNVSGSVVLDYGVNIKKGTLLAGQYIPVNLFGEETPFILEINQFGGATNYRPFSVIPPYGTVILQIMKK